LFSLAIEHLWISKSATIRSRERIEQFILSDHYAIKRSLTLKTDSFKK
jgi:hypothetical protein